MRLDPVFGWPPGDGPHPVPRGSGQRPHSDRHRWHRPHHIDPALDQLAAKGGDAAAAWSMWGDRP